MEVIIYIIVVHLNFALIGLILFAKKGFLWIASFVWD
ncbi:hypothetical protein EHR_10420 [Enterococcus hirae ATCC 9790]|uniref:Uncharacterized protein n=1 Tax=Enterococcus hirae (strain ATCC 9790 / DSM 20160 / JCM 8729 / LMG 6399 / NBRC 3181 / NCIMB 6459 / NCDO 1258 / NCTC 12367 / WDCM 00089 / R) TaxID=768486 RepID=I6T831_ENTHA|nr:hypothetical protein EHR_10420 [Enterococcus hirae ATCC 9790]